MINEFNQSVPGVYASIDEATRKRGFSMPSDILTCALLRTLAASKPAGKFLELGTGTGLSTSWILDGMDDEARLISLESNEKLLAVAENYLGQDNRLELIHIGGAEWIPSNAGGKFDYIRRHLAT
ncbi:MAG TPA: hypothetical protein VFX43_16450 [Chitinophagaceae bacterium]|nr:hypothetical protein [Chitinophagaceae bacterium]